MKESKILKKTREEIVLLCKGMKPEERLHAFAQHCQFIHQIYQAGVNYRTGFLPSRKRKIFRKR